jgi:hypothetical protein
MKTLVLCAVAAMMSAVYAASARSDVIAEHVGANDPATEGFTFNNFNCCSGILSPGTDTEPYWRIQREEGAAGRYLFGLTPAQLANPNGWTLTARAKANITSFTFDVYLGVDDGQDLWSLHLFQSGTWTIDSSFLLKDQLTTIDATAAYHEYKIDYNPTGGGGSGSVNYFVDDVAVGSQTRAQVPTQGANVNRVEFGDSNGLFVSDSQWSLVRFETKAPLGVPGDYNNNGVVDAADYVLWRKGGPLQNEVDTPGTVNAADYTEWRARFGNPPGSGSVLGGGTAVPEPTSIGLVMLMGLMATSSRRSVLRIRDRLR